MAEQAGPQSAGTSDGTFKGFERCLPENCVEYMLFIIDSQLQPQQIFSRLETVRKAAVQLSSQLTSEYIWQRDAFGLEVTTDKGLVYLHGITDYGDSIEDEWLIVYILRELTQKFPDLWVRVSDSDGEFLLVEAANVLPKWLSPENDANRAWVHGGQLRIIPLTLDVRSNPEKNMMLSEAVGILQSAAHTLIHSPFVEAEAFYRLEKYPAQIQDSIHHAVVSVPRRLAYLIHEVPKAIAPAVEAFYLRDPIAMKPLTSSSADLLIFPPRDFVDMSVKFTKVLYAQLKSQVFPAPSSWNDVFVSSERQAAADGSSAAQKKHAMLELGMKVTCGFEMLAKTTAKNNNRAVREIALLLEDLAEDGDSVLPKDADIASWKDCTRDDDDSWMDIDFQDFDKELDGRRDTPKAGAFGDASAHADLRRIVSRFEAFLNDDSAGLDGAEHDEMDEDDEDEDDEDYEEDTDSEDREISFDEEEFARMMREMMGLPVDANKAAHGSNRKASVADVPEVDREDEEIMQLSKQMELELNEHGALALDPRPEDSRALKDKGKNRAGAASGKTTLGGIDDDSESDEVDIDYNLAKNILESFKGQAGMAGPVGTMLAGMGIRLPRDEGEDEQSHP